MFDIYIFFRVAVAVGCWASIGNAVAGSGSRHTVEISGSAMDLPADIIGARTPNLHRSVDGAVYLSWQQPDGDDGEVLRFARWQDGAWSAPQTIARGKNWFVNWADFPGVAAFGSARLAAYWLQRSGPGQYDYDVHLTLSNDGGQSWHPAAAPHDTGAAGEHGFVSLLSLAGEGWLAILLDGSAYGNDDTAGSSTMLRYALVEPAGSISERGVIDRSTCDCCQTSLVITPHGPLAAWRARRDGEIRDIHFSHYQDGRWGEPRAVAGEGWSTPACPVNGPMLAAADDRVVLAWYTGADTSPRIRYAWSADGGLHFGPAFTIAAQKDETVPLGRVAVALIDHDRAAVTWLETAGPRANIMLQTIGPEGPISPPSIAAELSPGRDSGFPRLVKLDKTSLLLAWTARDNPSGIKLKRIMLDERAP